MIRILPTLVFFLLFTFGYSEHSRPNILFILTDDQRWDTLGAAGNPIIQTPSLDALASEGTHFQNAFVTTPICAASRASLMTGLYERTHAFTFRTDPLRKEFVNITYPKLLKDAGYFTGFIGKFGMTYAEDLDTSHFDVYSRPGEQFWAVTYYRLTPDHTGHRHLSENIGDESLMFLEQAAQTGRPFCLTISFHAPHAEDVDPDQFIYPVELEHLYEEDSIPSAALSDPHFFEEQPEWVKAGLNRIRWKWRFDTSEKYQSMVKAYYRMITGLDVQIGRVRDRLRELGLDQNTIIIFTSDNGFFLNERQLAGKWLMYENSLRVPLIVYDPRQTTPDSLEHMVLNIDIAPTILQYAGIPIPDAMQGLPLQSILNNPEQPLRDSFLCEHLFENPRIPKSEGVRTEKYKYFRYIDHPEHEELYDLESDPLEQNNLVRDPAYQTILAQLRKQCDALIAGAGQ